MPFIDGHGCLHDGCGQCFTESPQARPFSVQGRGVAEVRWFRGYHHLLEPVSMGIKIMI